MNTRRHCPYCNSTSVVGLGAFVDAMQTVVELRCRHCGELFFSNDRRTSAGEAADLARAGDY
jgi:transcription elongation factor Elf1